LEFEELTDKKDRKIKVKKGSKLYYHKKEIEDAGYEVWQKILKKAGYKPA